MATNNAKVLYRGAATTNTATTLYTVPSSTTTIVTNIVITNTSLSDQTFTIAFDGVEIAYSTLVEGGQMIVIDMKQVLATTKIISGGASATSVKFHISGVEVA